MHQPKIMLAAALVGVALATLMVIAPSHTLVPVATVDPVPVRVAPAIVRTTEIKPVEPKDNSVHLSGVGNPKSLGGEYSEKVYLHAGTYKIRVTHEGTGFFSMALMGEAYKEIAGQVGYTDVTVSFTLAEGDYRFGYQADGRWTVTITEVK